MITVWWILVNVMIAIVLEIYGSVSGEVDAKFDNINVRQKLYKILKDDDPDAMKRKLDEVQETLTKLQAHVNERQQSAKSEAVIRYTEKAQSLASNEEISIADMNSLNSVETATVKTQPSFELDDLDQDTDQIPEYRFTNLS